MSFEQRLVDLGITLPSAPRPVAAYVPGVRTGNLIFTAGQVPFVNGELAFRGKVGGELTVEQGREAARICALNALAVVRGMAGSLDKVSRIVKLLVFVNSAPGFGDQPQVANGASELMLEIFGEAGRHARSAVGSNELPLGAPVEVEMVVELHG
ncbi:MAG TPA: RidA family protein [Bacillota bacterium]